MDEGGHQSTSVQQARERFPRGLVQPEDGYRFSLDALLLARFARITPGSRGADLGCGSGPVALGVLLRVPRVHIVGVEREPTLFDAARKNRVLLGFENRFDIDMNDVSSYETCAGQLDFVLANPPYRTTGQGRTCMPGSRRDARFETRGGLDQFVGCAGRLLKNRGRFALVHLPERLADVVETCRRYDLEPKRILMVHSRLNESATILLAEAIKGGKAGLEVEAPLVLYEGTGQATKLTGQALAYCPALACNSKPSEGKDDG